MNCPTCSHAVFDALWGVYKCPKKMRDVHPEIDDPCSLYKEGKPKESVENEGLYDDDVC